MEVKEVIHRNTQPLKVILQKTHAGTYNWEIHAQAEDLERILPMLRKADLAMRKEYGGQ